MIFISTSCLKGENSRFTKDVFKVLEIYKKYNIKNIELGSVHSYVKDLSKIKKYQKENNTNFIIHCFFPPAKEPFYLNFASKNKDILKKSMQIAKNAIELCNKLDSNLYSTHGGFYADRDSNRNIISERISYGGAMEIAVTSFSEICDYASDYNVKVALENMFGFNNISMFNSTDDFNDFFKKVNSKNLGVLLDIGHAAIAKVKLGIDIKQFINKLKERIFEVHVHKSIGRKDTHHNIDSPDLLKKFDKDTLKKAALTLEANNLTPDEILKGKRIIEEGIKQNI